MKRILWLCLTFCIITGCTTKDIQMSQILQFRETLIQADGCVFQAKIAADYGQQIHRFSVECKADREGNLRFSLIEPESIAGISGDVTAKGGSLTFDSAVLGFPLLAEGMLAPVSAPWVMLNAMRSGYLTSYSKTEEGIQVTIHDSYAEDALQVDIWLDTGWVPFYAEILWKGRRILSLELEKFEIL